MAAGCERPDRGPAAGSMEGAVRQRYSAGASAREEALCCPVSYDAQLLEVIPAEVVERDYGCGDPTRHVRAGEVVLDLGSGAGKACFMASQVVGREGRVLGIDMNDDMLAVARDAAPLVAERIGHANVEFRKGKIQDLRLDRDRLDAWLAEYPVAGEADYQRLEAEIARLRADHPLVPDDSVDVVVSNCVLNLVDADQKRDLFGEIHRVLRPGGRAVIADIVSDEDVPERLQRDPELWSGCISGALREDLFVAAFVAAGFGGVTILERQAAPWRTVEGIEFRSLTVAAWKPLDAPAREDGHALIYKGPFRQVVDDEGRVLPRGVRISACTRTAASYAREPFRSHVEVVAPGGRVTDAGTPACAPEEPAPGSGCC